MVCLHCNNYVIHPYPRASHNGALYKSVFLLLSLYTSISVCTTTTTVSSFIQGLYLSLLLNLHCRSVCLSDCLSVCFSVCLLNYRTLWIDIHLLRKTTSLLRIFLAVGTSYLKLSDSGMWQDNQKDLENATEQLSEYLERDITTDVTEIKQKVQDKYRSVCLCRLLSITVSHAADTYQLHSVCHTPLTSINHTLYVCHMLLTSVNSIQYVTNQPYSVCRTPLTSMKRTLYVTSCTQGDD